MDKNLKILIYIGISGSGKSTSAKEFVKKNPTWISVGLDDFRFMLKNSPVCDDKLEKLINDLMINTINSCLSKKLNCIIDNTNLKASYLNEFIDEFKYRADIEFRIFDVPLKTCIERDSLRERKVGEDVINKQFKNYKILIDSFDFSYKTKRNKFEISKIQYDRVKDLLYKETGKTKAVICDIDGTLTFMGNRSPYDWMKVSCDLPNYDVIEHLKMQKNASRYIIIVSGRDSICRNLTIEWLNFYNVPFDDLFMRKQNDFRPDNIVKMEIYQNFIEPNFDIVCVYDDRDQVIKKCWQALYLSTHSVNKSPD